MFFIALRAKGEVMARKKNVAPVADEQTQVGVVDAPETGNEPQVENATPEAPQFGEATDIPPAPETPATDSPVAETPAEAPTQGTTNGEKKHFLAAHTHNWLNSRASKKIGPYRNGKARTVADDIRDEIRKGLISGEISKGEDGFVSHDLVVEMLRDYEGEKGFSSAGNPLDAEARNYFRSTPFGGGWLDFKLFPELLGLEPGDTVTLPQLQEAISLLQLEADGEQVVCPGLDETNPCGRQFTPVKGLVYRRDGTQVTTKEGSPVEFGAFVRSGDEAIGFCPACQHEANSRAFRLAKERNAKPVRIYFKPRATVQGWIDEGKARVEEAAAIERRKDKAVLSLGKIGQIFRNANARGKRGQSRNDKRWK